MHVNPGKGGKPTRSGSTETWQGEGEAVAWQTSREGQQQPKEQRSQACCHPSWPGLVLETPAAPDDAR